MRKCEGYYGLFRNSFIQLALNAVQDKMLRYHQKTQNPSFGTFVWRVQNTYGRLHALSGCSDIAALATLGMHVGPKKLEAKNVAAGAPRSDHVTNFTLAGLGVGFGEDQDQT